MAGLGQGLRLRLAASALLLVLTISIAPSHASAQTPPGDAAAEQAGGVEKVLQKLEALEAGQERLLKRLEEVESRLKQEPGEFSRIVVRVQGRDGKPLAGYSADLRLKSERVARATGTSDEKGLAIDRLMPYGEYSLLLSEPTGWSAQSTRVILEVGVPRELTVVAPDPAERGRLILTSGLRKDAFAGLPFGGTFAEMRSSAGRHVRHALEPDFAESKGFPTVGDGIDQVGVSVRFFISMLLEQPDGRAMRWNWSPPGESPSKDRIVATPEGLSIWSDIGVKTAKGVDGSKYFGGLDWFKDIDFAQAAEELARESISFEVPSGDVHVQMTGLYGRATTDVLAAMHIEPGDARSIWLNAELRPGSQWIGRLFDDKWVAPEQASNHVVSRNVVVEAGKETTVELASP